MAAIDARSTCKNHLSWWGAQSVSLGSISAQQADIVLSSTLGGHYPTSNSIHLTKYPEGPGISATLVFREYLAVAVAVRPV